MQLKKLEKQERTNSKSSYLTHNTYSKDAYCHHMAVCVLDLGHLLCFIMAPQINLPLRLSNCCPFYITLFANHKREWFQPPNPKQQSNGL